VNAAVRLAAVLVLAVLLPAAAGAKTVQSVDALLSALASAKSQDSAKQIEDQLAILWAHSGSPSADLLLQRAQTALDDNDSQTGRTILKALTAIAPNFAGGWHTRAEAALGAEDYSDALLSLRRTLQLEPRQYDALASLAGILEDLNDKPHALAAYRRALAIDPFAQGVRDRVRELERDVEGQKI
jgi:Tfp pilus assembly protein PilF